MGRRPSINKGRNALTPEIKSQIIHLFVKEGFSTYQISEAVGFSDASVNNVLKQYYNEIGEVRPVRRKIPEKRKEYTPDARDLPKEEVREGLINFLKQGRPPYVVYKLSQKYGVDITGELAEYGFEIPEKEEDKER